MMLIFGIHQEIPKIFNLFLPQEIYDRIHTVYRIAGGRAFTRSEPTERVMIMITWVDVFAFVTMLVTILLYIETHRKHKK